MELADGAPVVHLAQEEGGDSVVSDKDVVWEAQRKDVVYIPGGGAGAAVQNGGNCGGRESNRIL